MNRSGLILLVILLLVQSPALAQGDPEHADETDQEATGTTAEETPGADPSPNGTNSSRSSENATRDGTANSRSEAQQGNASTAQNETDGNETEDLERSEADELWAFLDEHAGLLNTTSTGSHHDDAEVAKIVEELWQMLLELADEVVCYHFEYGTEGDIVELDAPDSAIHPRMELKIMGYGRDESIGAWGIGYHIFQVDGSSTLTCPLLVEVPPMPGPPNPDDLIKIQDLP